MKFRQAAIFIFLLMPGLLGAQVLEGITGNAQLLREAEGHYFDGLKALMLEKPEEASKSFVKSLDLNPANAAAHFKLAEIQLGRNEITDARAHINSAVKLEPNNRYYQEMLADIQELDNDWKGAIKTWRKMAGKREDDSDIRLTVARICIDHKEYKEAIKELELCQKESGPSNMLFELRQNLYMKKGDVKGAIQDGEEWVKLLPEDPEAWFSLCRLLLANKKVEEGKARLFQMVERFPDNPAAHLMLADVYLQENNIEKSRKEMRLAFASPELPIESKIDIVAGYLSGPITPEDSQDALELCDVLMSVHPGDARVFIVRGDLLNQANRHEEAREMYLKARAKDRNNFGLWEQLILIDLNLNEIDSLVIHTSEARTLFPNTPSFAFYNGMGLFTQKKYLESVEALEQAARISLENKSMQLEIYTLLGDAYFSLKQLDKAFRNYDEALLLDSSNGHVLNNYSYYLSLEKINLNKAVAMSSKLMQLFPEDPTYLDTHGWVLFQCGRFEEALVPLEKASKASGSGVIWEHYGDALFKSGKTAEGEAAWKKALELGGGTSPDLPSKISNHKL
jgi:tetratricopeptide (TPR) repeat protein